MTDDCLKLTTYFGERDRTEDRFVADALLDLYGRKEVQTSVMLRGAEGFGLKHHLHTDRLLTLSEDLPLVSVAVDTRSRIEALLDEVAAIKRHGLITLERARMLTGEIEAVSMPEELHEATKLTIYVGRQERINGSPAFVAISDLFHRRRLAGATVLLGVDGTAHGLRQRARFFGRNVDVPMMIITVGAGDQIARILPELGTLLSRPLVTLERVRVCKIDGRLLAQPTPLPSSDQHGLDLWQKLMVYTSEQARYGNSPLHVACSGVCARAGRLVPHACAGSGDSTATARPKAIGCCSCDVMCRWSRSSSTHRSALQGRFRSSTKSLVRPGW